MENYISNQDLEKFFKYCDNIHNIRERFAYDEDNEEWSEEREINYLMGGTICGLYREKDKFLISLLNKGCNDQMLKPVLETWYAKDHKEHVEIWENMGRTCSFIESDPPSGDLVEWIKNYNYEIIRIVEDESKDIIQAYLYLYFQYDQHRSLEIEFDQPNIEKLYTGDEDGIVDKYGLIHVGGRIRLELMFPPRIYDSGNNYTIMLEIENSLAGVLDELKKKGQIKSLALRGRDGLVFDKFIKTQYLCEALERGRIFSLGIERLPDISKFYDFKKYGDQLSVKKTDTDLTFEELSEEFDVEDNFITTQVIHLQYEYDNDESYYYISHMDHEYVFYTEDEYISRMNDENEKGNARKRIKTFKLDKARISFDYPCNVFKDESNSNEKIEVPFIYFVLNIYFKHKDLLREYFEEILSI